VTDAALLYLCDWLPPDFGAVGQYSLGFARDYARRGRRVILVGLSSRASSVEEERIGTGQLTVVRLQAPPYDKGSLLSRASWTLRADLRLFREVARRAGTVDEIVFTGAPPFMIHFLVPGNLWWRRRLVYRITDFWPECLIAARGRSSLALDLLLWWTWLLRRRVHRFQVLGEDQRALLEAMGISANRIELKRDPAPVAITGNEPLLPRPPELNGKIALLYSGNWGVAHDTDTFLRGYERHHAAGSGRVGLWLNAVGSGAQRVAEWLASRGLPFARTQPVPLSSLASLLCTADAHLVTLKNEFVGYVLPSKIYGCVETRKPLLFIGSAASDVHRVAAERLPPSCYWRVEVGDAHGVAAALEAIADRVEWSRETAIDRAAE
jgi:hypothetical protein